MPEVEDVRNREIETVARALEPHMNGGPMTLKRAANSAIAAHDAARRSQGEDHEDPEARDRKRLYGFDPVAPSPERNTEKLVEALRSLIWLKDRPDHDSIDKEVKDRAWAVARRALAEYSSTTGDKGQKPAERG